MCRNNCISFFRIAQADIEPERLSDSDDVWKWMENELRQNGFGKKWVVFSESLNLFERKVVKVLNESVIWMFTFYFVIVKLKNEIGRKNIFVFGIGKILGLGFKFDVGIEYPFFSKPRIMSPILFGKSKIYCENF